MTAPLASMDAASFWLRVASKPTPRTRVPVHVPMREAHVARCAVCSPGRTGGEAGGADARRPQQLTRFQFRSI